MNERVVIIGGGTAGASAAFAARKINRKAEITVLEREPYPTYSRCGLPFVIKGIIPSFEDLIVFPETVYKQQRINYRKNVLVTMLDPGTQTVQFQDKASIEKLNYTALVIATGAVPARPSIPGLDQAGVYILRTIADAQSILNALGKVRRALIIGASFIGLEIAEALASKGIAVTVVEALRLLWRIVDEDTGELIKQYLRTKGITLIERSSLQQIIGQPLIKSGVKAVISDKTALPQELQTDMVIVATGIKPEVSLARAAGIQLGPTGAIKISQRVETNLKDIYAVGDCTEVTSFLTGESIISGLGTVAARHGLVAGANAAGAGETLPNILNTSILKICDLETASVGVTEEHLRNHPQEKFQPVSVLIKHRSLPHYYPGGADIWVKLIAESRSGQLIGAQLVSEAALTGRINLLALAIEKGITLNEIARTDFGYSPPCSDLWDPLVIAARGLQSRMKKPTPVTLRDPDG
jgi:NADPH-dependent 2,4-dienoyl-CoA reductase/sulfur reductase-like enzyme